MDASASSRRGSLISLIVIAAIAIVYFSTLTNNYTEAEDSLHYLTLIERGETTDLFSRDHLIHLALNRGFFDVWKALGYSGNAELPARVLNVFAGIAGLAVLLALLRALEVPLYLRVLCAVGLAFSYTYWLYTSQCETYILPIAFIIGTFYGLVKVLERPSAIANHVWIGIFTAMAILLHRQHALLFAVIVVGYLLLFAARRAVMTLAMLIKALAVYCGVCAGIVLASYTAAGVLVHGFSSFGEMRGWLFQHAYFGVGKVSLASPAVAAVGLSRAILSTHYLFSFPQMVAKFEQTFPTKSLREEVFLVRTLPQWLSGLLVLLTAVFVLSVAVALVEVIRKRSFRVLYSTKAGSLKAVYCCWIAVVYILAYSAFNIWWEPVNPEFWISVLPVLGILCALVTSRIFDGKVLKAAVTLAAVLLFVINLMSGILPMRNPENDYWRITSRWFVDNVGEGDLVVTGGGRLARSYIEYYAGADAFSTAMPLPEEEIWRRYQETVEQVRPERILVSSTLLSPNPEYLRQFNNDGSASVAVFERLKPHLEVLHSDSLETIYLYGGAHQ